MDKVQDHFGLNSLQRLKSLCKMLRNNADQILAGEMSITISSITLYELNEAVDNLQDGLSPPNLSLDSDLDGNKSGNSRTSDLEDWNFNLQLVLDIISTAPVLVVYKPRTGSTVSIDSSPPQSSPNRLLPLRLGYFTSLNHLEISCVPIQSIQDLLKMRERLETLVVVNCFAKNFRIQDVLEMCDQEVSVPMQWAVLQHLCLRNNNLTELDGSLRLCPRLEMLDLSRNNLTTTDVYLGYLMELTHLDLSYNSLKGVPSLSATAKKKLKNLLLAGNKVSTLFGMEEMTNLEKLDISDNVIPCHDCLLPVKCLHRLDKLNMRGCPATLKKDHRVQALKYISTVSLSRKFSLDGRPVTNKEIQNSRAMIGYSQPSSLLQLNTQRPTSMRHILDHTDGPSHMARSDEERPSTADDLAVSVTSLRRKKSRKKAKTRTMDIQDMDVSGGDLSSREVTPSTTPKAPSRMEALAQLRKQEVQETRAEMEHLRNYYGNSWLQAVEDKGVIPRPASTVDARSLVPATATESASTKSQTLRKSGTDINLAAGRDKMTTKVEIHSSDLDHQLTRNSGTSELSAEESTSTWVKPHERGEDLSKRAFNKDDLFLSSGSGAEDGGANDLPSNSSSRHIPKDDGAHFDEDSQRVKGTIWRDGDSNMGNHVDKKLEGGADNVVPEARQKVSPSLYNTQDSVLEPEDQGEPFIVTLPDWHDDPFMITVSPRFLVEKDINGVMQDKLDLQSLESVRIEVEDMICKPERERDEDNGTDTDYQEVKVILDFSYFRKDRRCRVFVMEDFLTAQHLCELVQPFVDAKKEAALKKLQVQYQCLKCNSQFSKGEATTVVYRESIPHTGSIRDFSSLADIGGEKVMLHCPKCQSDHVVQLETENTHDQVTTTTTTISSSLPSDGILHSIFSRKQSVEQLMPSNSPKAHSTPLKRQSSYSSDTQFIRSMDQKGSRSSASRNLFVSEDDGGKQIEDGVRSFDSIFSKQEGDSLLKSHQVYNAFNDQTPPVETRCHSDTVASPTEFLEREASGSVVSHGSETDRTRPSASNTLMSVDVVDSFQMSRSGALNSLHLSSSVNSSDWSAGRPVASSVDSDITILNKRDSSASVVVLSSQVPSDGSQTDSAASRQDDGMTWVTDRTVILGGNEFVPDTNRRLDENTTELLATTNRGKLTPVQQEPDSIEVTPMGSPLSSSICSSMVSSVYQNSLLPNTNASDVNVTASDLNATEEVSDDDNKNEMSIYDQAEVPIPVHRLSHKASISSEVEVLLVEEGTNQIQDDSSSFHFAANASTATTTTLISDNDSIAQETTSYYSADSQLMAGAVTAAAESGTFVSSMVNIGGEYNFKHLDHRLLLYLMMTIFDNSEEFSFKVKASVCQYMMPEEYEAFVAVTNMKLYILRINTEDPSVELNEAMTLMEAQPHAEMRRVDVGLGRQSLRLEFTSDCSSYTLVMRDGVKVDMFMELLSEQLQTYGLDTGIPMCVVFNKEADQETLDTLSVDVLDRGGKSQQALRLYSLGYIARGHNPQYPIAFVVSSSEMCLVKPNHQWPSPQYQTPITVDTVGKQFTVLERQKINNIATVAVHESNERRMRIAFFNESSGDETLWLVSMETETGVRDLIRAVRAPWEEEFGVDLDVEMSDFDLAF